MKRILICLNVVLMLAGAMSAGARQRVGLVLSGGGAKGVAHIGVIQALEDHDIAIDYVTGTSMGAVVGSLYAMGYSPAEMMTLLESPEFGRWASGELDAADTYYMLEGKATPAMLRLNVGGGHKSTGKDDRESAVAGVVPTSLINPLPMSLAFMELYGGSTAQCNRDFDKLFVPFRCVCSDVYHKHKVVLRDGSLGDAVRASMSFPLVFRPIEIDGLLMYDGGIYDNYPFDVMQEEFNPDVMIGVNVSGPNGKPNPASLMSQLDDLIMQKSDYDMPQSDGITIKIDLKEFSLLDFAAAKQIYEIGYRHGEAMADSIARRVTARMPAEELAKRRHDWRSATPQLLFDSVSVRGCSDGQAEYLRRVFNAEPGRDTLSLDDVKRAFYRAVSPGRFSSLTPHAVLDSKRGLFELQLDARMKQQVEIGAGGYVTTGSNSFLYLSGALNRIDKVVDYIGLETWVGQSYQAAVVKLRRSLATRTPMDVSVEASVQRQKLHESETYFYRWGEPTFVSHEEVYGKVRYGIAAGMRGVVDFTVGYGHLWDRWRASGTNMGDPGRDKMQRDLGQASGRWVYSTLDNVNYPTRGAHVEISIAGVGGSVDYDEGERETVWWGTLRGRGEWYAPLGRHFSVGMGLEGVASSRPLLRDYNATMVSSTAWTPTPESHEAYNPAFRSTSWIAGSVMPVWKVSKLLQVRGFGGCFVPARRIVCDEHTGVARYGERWFDAVRFLGQAEVMVTLPFATLRGYVSYRTDAATRWSVGLSLGLFHTAPTFL